MAMKDARVILARCQQNKKLFGMRIENQGTIRKHWIMDWAFQIDEESARNEGFDSEKVMGNIDITIDYPGCPYCGSTGFVVCGNCGRLCCWNDGSYSTCAWCGDTRRVGGEYDGAGINGAGQL